MIPAAVAEVARTAAQSVSEGLVGGEVSLAGVEVAEALLGRRTLLDQHLRAIVAHTYGPGTVNADLFGGHEGRAWAATLLGTSEVRTAAVSERPDLRAMSKQLNAINRRFRDRVDVVLAQAMRAAIRKADRKAGVRAKNATTKRMAGVRDQFEQRVYSPPVLAALAVTTQELLDESFADAAEQIDLLFQRRQRERRKVLAATFPDVEADELEREWSPTEQSRGAEIRAFVIGAMFTEAARRLEQPRDAAFVAPEGEAPVDPASPGAVVADVVRVADGAPVGPAGVEDPQPQDGTGKPPTWDYTDELVSGLVSTKVPGAVTTYEWAVGAPERPFEPHQELAGVTFNDDTFWSICAKDPADFPYGDPAYMPGDHDGCQCELEVMYDAADEEGTGGEE